MHCAVESEAITVICVCAFGSMFVVSLLNQELLRCGVGTIVANHGLHGPIVKKYSTFPREQDILCLATASLSIETSKSGCRTLAF